MGHQPYSGNYPEPRSEAWRGLSVAGSGQRAAKFIRLAIVAATCLFGFAGVSSVAGAGTSGVATAKANAAKYLTAPKTINQTVALPKAPPKGKSIIFLESGQVSNTQTYQGVQAAAKAVGWKTSAISYDPANPSTLQAAFAEALAKHPTFVTEDGIPQSQFGASTIASYKKAGVKIIVGSAFPVKIGGPIIGTPNNEASLTFIGQIVADWFVANSNGTGQALVESAPGFPVLLGFTSAFKSTVAKLCPACVVQVVDVTLAEIESGQVVPTVVAQLQSHTNLNYVFFDNDGFADGITSALAAAGLTKVIVGGNGLDVDASDGLRAGTESVWTGYSPYYNGYATVDIALRSVEGVPLTAGDGVQPTELLTRANIGGITAAWNRPTNALAQYEKLWKVKITACTLGCNGG